MNGLHHGLDTAAVIALAGALIAVATLRHAHHAHQETPQEFAEVV